MMTMGTSQTTFQNEVELTEDKRKLEEELKVLKM